MTVLFFFLLISCPQSIALIQKYFTDPPFAYHVVSPNNLSGRFILGTANAKVTCRSHFISCMTLT